MDIKRITEENFADIEPSLLRDPQWWPQMEDMVLSIDAAYTPEYSKQYAILLREKLEPVIDSLPADLQAKYLRMFKVLRLQSLLTVADEEKQKFFREGILDTFRASYTNVRLWVELIFLSNSKARDIIDAYRKLCVGALRENMEALGGEQIKLPAEDAPKPPILRNWLADYEAFARNLPTRPPSSGRIEEGRYLTTSANATKLNSADRDILLKVLELYDWLKYSKMEFDFSYPGVKPEPEAPGEEKEHILIPRELADAVNEFRDKKRARKNTNIPPVPPKAPVAKMPAGPQPVPSPKMDFSQRNQSSPKVPIPPVSPKAPVAKMSDFQSEKAPFSGRRTPSLPVPPRILSQALKAEGRSKMDLLKPEPVSKQPAITQKSFSPPNPEQQKATLIAGSSLFNMSLSHALANADQGLTESGNIRSGAQTPRPPKESPKATFAAPKQPNQKSKLPPNLPVGSPVLPAEQGKPGAQPESGAPLSGLVDLSKRRLVEIKSVTRPEQLQKIDLADTDGMMFESRLGEIKQKIMDLSREYQLPATRVAENFYRSPLYQLFMSMGVAVMNDTSSADQRAVFEKVAGNYKMAGKPYLSREQFLSLSRLKKEISESEASI